MCAFKTTRKKREEKHRKVKIRRLARLIVHKQLAKLTQMQGQRQSTTYPGLELVNVLLSKTSMRPAESVEFVLSVERLRLDWSSNHAPPAMILGIMVDVVRS